MSPRLLEIPQRCRVVWGMFAEAVVEKLSQARDNARDADEQERLLGEFVKSFEILLRHSSDDMLRLLAESRVEDLVYTLVCYLPESVRDPVSKYLAEHREQRTQIVDAFTMMQRGLNDTIRAEIEKGNMPVARALGKTA